MMDIRAPTKAEVRRLGRELKLGLTNDEVEAFWDLGGRYTSAYTRVAELVEEREGTGNRKRAVTSYWPTGDDNRGNAWAARCRIEGSTTGSLVDKRIAIKDNICVNGVPMLIGSPLMEGFVPSTDAVVVEHVLAAGGVIVGKTAVPGFCFDGASITGFPEPHVHNPWREQLRPRRAVRRRCRRSSSTAKRTWHRDRHSGLYPHTCVVERLLRAQANIRPRTKRRDLPD